VNASQIIVVEFLCHPVTCCDHLFTKERVREWIDHKRGVFTNLTAWCHGIIAWSSTYCIAYNTPIMHTVLKIGRRLHSEASHKHSMWLGNRVHMIQYYLMLRPCFNNVLYRKYRHIVNIVRMTLTIDRERTITILRHIARNRRNLVFGKFERGIMASTNVRIWKSVVMMSSDS
jgi:hypothetical protein